MVWAAVGGLQIELRLVVAFFPRGGLEAALHERDFRLLAREQFLDGEKLDLRHFLAGAVVVKPGTCRFLLHWLGVGLERDIHADFRALPMHDGGPVRTAPTVRSRRAERYH